MLTTFSVILTTVLLDKDIFQLFSIKTKRFKQSFLSFIGLKDIIMNSEEKGRKENKKNALPDPTGSCYDQGQGSRHDDDAAHD